MTAFPAFLQHLRSDNPELHAELVADQGVKDDEDRVGHVGGDGHVAGEHLEDLSRCLLQDRARSG